MVLQSQFADESQENKDRPSPDPHLPRDTELQAVHDSNRRPKPSIGEKDKPPHPSAMFAHRYKTTKMTSQHEHAC